MPLRHTPSIYIPSPSSQWSFNESASPLVDKGGFANYTTGGTVTFNGDSITTGVSSGYFQTAAGVYGKIPCFTYFGIVKPLNNAADSDIYAMGSGVGFTADDYTWYVDNNSTSNGFYFGVAPGAGDYGFQLGVNTGSIDTTKKHWFMFGYVDTPSTNNGFLFVKREGDPLIYSNTSIVMSAFVTGRSFYLSNTAYFPGGTINATYYLSLYWDNLYLQDLTLFQRLCERYSS